jgi:Asp/Glu/hydantoin racemase
MTKTLALLHTTLLTVAALKDLAAKELPGVRVINLLDDSLLADVIAAGGVTPAVEARMKAYVEQAAVAGAQGLLSCCSSVGEALERIAPTATIPLFRIDGPMAAEAVRIGNRIGVIATVGTTLEPTANLIRSKAAEAAKAVAVESLLVSGAFAALQAGRSEEHDRLVLAALEGLLSRSDVVVLAQASMARLLGSLSDTPRVPILTSPVAGIQAAGAAL